MEQKIELHLYMREQKIGQNLYMRKVVLVGTTNQGAFVNKKGPERINKPDVICR
jgi:hypothetical protein